MALELEDRKGYRSRLEIVRDVLLVAEAGDSGSRKTHIMYGANLSYKLLTKYLDEVLEAGLVCEDESGYFITDKGREFLEHYGSYEKRLRDVRDRINHMNSGKETLEKMLES